MLLAALELSGRRRGQIRRIHVGVVIAQIVAGSGAGFRGEILVVVHANHRRRQVMLLVGQRHVRLERLAGLEGCTSAHRGPAAAAAS